MALDGTRIHTEKNDMRGFFVLIRSFRANPCAIHLFIQQTFRSLVPNTTRTNMKNIIAILCVAVFIGQSNAQKIKKVLFVIADGIPADVIESIPHPNLDKIARAGAYKRAYVGGAKGGYSQTPTISAVSYNSLLTGTWVNKHNVWGNDIKAPNYNYPTIFRLFKDQYPLKKTAIYSTWKDNRTKLIGEGLAQTGKIKMDHVFDGYEHDTITFPHDKESGYIHLIDEKVVMEAARSVKENAPDLSWVYLEYTDDMGHRYGTGAKQNEAIAMLDVQIGKIWDAIEYRRQNFNEDWLIIVTTDHGRDAATGRDHGGQSERERTTWLFTNAKQLNKYFDKHQPAITDFLPTMARHLSINIPSSTQQELDGTTLTGPVSISNAKAIASADSIIITWDSFEASETVKILIATTDHAKEGKPDTYMQLAEVPSQKKSFSFMPQKKTGAESYKIVLEGKSNVINTRVSLDDGKL
jgi:predicted AlkP superfamily pyrophosphatase or phosphodiesterase